jgi:hypothetical protein
MKVPLPDGAIAFDFGSAGGVVPGFKGVSNKTAFKMPGGYVATPASEGAKDQRLIYGFENPSEAAELTRSAEEGTSIEVAQDKGVSQGKGAIRIVGKKGGGFADFRFDNRVIKNWSKFDYVAVDVFTEDEHPYGIYLELWDGRTKNFRTRCTYRKFTKAGKQTLLYQITRARRNEKERVNWERLAPEDKMQKDALTRVKMFFVTRKDRDAVLWLDNIRLIKGDPTKAPAGSSEQPKPVVVNTKSFGFLSTKGLKNGGKGWPDLLAGTFVTSSGKMEFKAGAPNGKYRAWLCSGPIIKGNMTNRRYLLQLNGQTILDDSPTSEEFSSEKYLYRFLWTQYSEKPNALWENYISRMYPANELDIEVKDGLVSLSAVNHFISSLILIPHAKANEFASMAASVRKIRIEKFYKTFYSPKQKKPAKKQGDGDYVLYVPDDWKGTAPWTEPSETESRRTQIVAAGAPGQRVVMRIAVMPFADLGECSLNLSDLTGPGTIPKSAIKGHFLNYRSNGQGVREMALLPRLTLQMEKAITQCFWLWTEIPPDAPTGKYKATFTFQPGKGQATDIPLSLEVYSFKLDDILPVSYGMYYGGRSNPRLPAAVRRKVLKEQLRWMRHIGFTAVPAYGASVAGVNRRAKQVRMRFDSTFYDLAKEVGMGRHPEQTLMATSLGVGRAIGRRLPGSIGAKVDQNPGIELRQPGFRELFINAMTQYQAFIEKTGMPVAMEIVDEPREVPNPWNRNLADTINYGDMLHQVKGIRTFVTPMGDTQSGKDYTSLVDHADIISVHAYKSSKRMMQKTKEKGKTLWLYNTGMDRFSWGFYNWRVESKGRWEWHFNWVSDSTAGGYPGREWYNPFTGLHGYAPNAPYHKYPGGMLYQSAYLNVSEGINDYAYLTTLLTAIEANRQAGKNAETIKKAEAFLAALRRVIPEFPNVKGLVNETDGALVGMGIQDSARTKAQQWRAKIAEYLKVLKR